MVIAILETTIIIDFVRNYPPAVVWLKMQTDAFGITPLIWIEAISGGNNKVERLRVAKLLKQYEMLYLSHADMDWAMERQMQLQLTYGFGNIDCLIASTSARLQLPMYTRNLKHFKPILGNLAQSPY